jgi:uridine phosphorylase
MFVSQFHNMNTIPQQSELILNPDGSVYHLKLKAEHIADVVLVVGDQNRVPRIAKYFDTVEFVGENREFRTATGFYKGSRFTVLSTGIGTDNIDIVLNELDAAVNYDLETRLPKKEHRGLTIIRLGTTGGIQEEIPIDSLLISKAAVGLDGLLNYYDSSPSDEEAEMENRFIEQTDYPAALARPYIRMCDETIAGKLAGKDVVEGITLTSPGFYAPQTRSLRAALKYPHLFEAYQKVALNGTRITNFEMETSALYGLGKALGHKCCTICAVIANRATGKFSQDHGKAEEQLVKHVLDKLTS